MSDKDNSKKPVIPAKPAAPVQKPTRESTKTFNESIEGKASNRFDFQDTSTPIKKGLDSKK